MLSLKKGSVIFDEAIKTMNGSISGITNDPSIIYIAKMHFNYNQGNLCEHVPWFHEMIGRCGIERSKKTTNIHGLRLKGLFKVCKDCKVAKARQRNVNQDWKGGSQVSEKSSIKGESYGGSRF
jgi:hypothetical protein